jgi:threonine 3-dehydrogenase
VSGEGHIVCGTAATAAPAGATCASTPIGIGVNRDGAFADYVVMPATNVWVQPDEIDPDLGAIFDPLGNATHTALQWPMVGEDVLVTGAGPIGVMAAAIARHAGAGTSWSPTSPTIASTWRNAPAPTWRQHRPTRPGSRGAARTRHA